MFVVYISQIFRFISRVNKAKLQRYSLAEIKILHRRIKYSLIENKNTYLYIFSLDKGRPESPGLPYFTYNFPGFFPVLLSSSRI